MTHKVHPYAHRLGLLTDWRSRWFGGRDNYQAFLRTDVLVREFLEKKLRGFYVSAVEMERGANYWRVIIKTSRPGMVIGRSGEGATKLRQEVLAYAKKIEGVIPRDFKIDIEEVKNPDADAAIVAFNVAEGLEKRLPFRRVLKQTTEKVLAARGVDGVRIDVSGRLGGAEIARKESLKKGRLPLQTLRANIDFAREKAYLSYGVIGVKVWIYKGQVFDEIKK
ncbi:MAG: 30S ribosomal protein S3 [Patescibacteria group bacterium]